MKLYLISQSDVDDYDTFSDAVVAAESEDQARRMHPSWDVMDTKVYDLSELGNSSWTDDPTKVEVRYLGEAGDDITVPTVICSSFHAG